jgi:hypothetical protein
MYRDFFDKKMMIRLSSLSAEKYREEAHAQETGTAGGGTAGGQVTFSNT